MRIFKLPGIDIVDDAITASSTIYGSYKAIELLTRVLIDVAEPDDFEDHVEGLESKLGRSYQGPEKAGREVIKAVKTAANEDGKKQDALLELISLVLVRLGVSQGSRVLSLVLLACGVDPKLLKVVIKLCMVLAKTEAGKRIVEAASPKLTAAVASCLDRTELDELLRQLAAKIGDKGTAIVNELARKPVKVVQQIIDPREPSLAKLVDNLTPPERS